MPSSKPFHKDDVAGKTVIDSSGKVMGKVSDVTFTLDGTITFWVQREDGSNTPVQMGRVMGVSDHVIVREEGAAATPSAAAPPKPGMVRCKACGTEATIGTMWCPNCGRSLG